MNHPLSPENALRVNRYLQESSLCAFLRDKPAKLLFFLVERNLAGAPPSARTIAKDHYHRAAARADSLLQVREPVGKLRSRLDAYYGREGKNDPVVLSLPLSDGKTGYKIEFTFPLVVPPDPPWVSTLLQSGLRNALRIKAQNANRLARVAELIDEEAKSTDPWFRLVASSGYSYLGSVGPVWSSAGLAQAMYEQKAKFEVVLESPFSDFAECRALANNVTHHHWEGKVFRKELLALTKECPRLSVRVTTIPVNCSLFLTKKSVLYDPYLWARPGPGIPTENNFWVFEFRKANEADGMCAPAATNEQNYNCYDLLEGHFGFILKNSVPLEKFIGATRSFQSRTTQFEKRVKARLSQARGKSSRNL